MLGAASVAAKGSPAGACRQLSQAGKMKETIGVGFFRSGDFKGQQPVKEARQEQETMDDPEIGTAPFLSFLFAQGIHTR